MELLFPRNQLESLRRTGGVQIDSLNMKVAISHNNWTCKQPDSLWSFVGMSLLELGLCPPRPGKAPSLSLLCWVLPTLFSFPFFRIKLLK